MSTIQFLNANELDNSYANQIDFENIETQNTFWQNQILSSFDVNISTSRLLVGNLDVFMGLPYSKFIGVNYCRIYQDGRFWYFFITNKQYVNENNTQLFLEMDVFQTFMFEHEITDSYVEREHQDRFTSELKPIFSLTNENIEVGDQLIKISTNKIYDNVPQDFPQNQKFGNANLFWAKIVTSEPLNNSKGSLFVSDTYKGNDTQNNTTCVNSMPTNVYYYIAPVIYVPAISIGILPIFYINNSTTFDAESILMLTNKDLVALSQDPRIISINISRYCPVNYRGAKRTITSPITVDEYVITLDGLLENTEYSLVQYKPENVTTNQGGLFRLISVNENSSTKTLSGTSITITPNLDINSLKSISNEPKLYHKDFTKFVLELGLQKQPLDIMLKNDMYKFTNSFSINSSETLSPYKYASNEENASIEFGLNISGSSTEMPLRTDKWLEYLSQHKNSLITGLTTSAISNTLGTGLQLGAGGIGVVTGIRSAFESINNIASSIAQVNDLKNTPDTISNPANDYILSFIQEDVFFKEKMFQIPEKYLMRVFNYLYVYGYKTNEIKTPNIKSRYYFNYIKTIGVNIKSNLDNNYISKLSEIYNNGITIWHYRNSVTWKGLFNYDYENAEMNLI